MGGHAYSIKMSVLRYMVLACIIVATKDFRLVRCMSENNTDENGIFAAGPSSGDAEETDVIIEWTLKEYEPLDIASGMNLIFQWSSAHNVYKLTDEESYDACE